MVVCDRCLNRDASEVTMTIYRGAVNAKKRKWRQRETVARLHLCEACWKDVPVLIRTIVSEFALEGDVEIIEYNASEKPSVGGDNERTTSNE